MNLPDLPLDTAPSTLSFLSALPYHDLTIQHTRTEEAVLRQPGLKATAMKFILGPLPPLLDYLPEHLSPTSTLVYVGPD